MSKYTQLVNDIIMAIRRVAGSDNLTLHAPEFKGKEWDYVKDCIDSTFVSSVGKYVDQFEDQLINYTGANYAIAVISGTAALHISLVLSGVRPNDEVLIPSLSFVATANAVHYCGACPHFVDVEITTLGVDVQKLRDYLEYNSERAGGMTINKHTGRVIRAVVQMHAFGHPGDIFGLQKLAYDFNLVLVEDAAESLGSFYYGKHTGTFGLLGALSFNGNKIVTTGGGGAILTNNPQLAARAKHITKTAKISHPWNYYHDEIGYNYRLPNLNAALGCAQLEHLAHFISEKRNLFQCYNKEFSSIDGVSILSEPPNCKSNYWLQALILDNQNTELRDDILSATNKSGIMTRPTWKLLHSLPPFIHCPRMQLSSAINMESRVINIPSSAYLGRSCL